MIDEQIQRQAEERVDARLGFYVHATVYVLVNTLLWTINLLKTPDYLWARWASLGWGIGLVAHGVRVFADQRRTGRIRARMIEREVQRMESQQDSVVTH